MSAVVLMRRLLGWGKAVKCVGEWSMGRPGRQDVRIWELQPNRAVGELIERISCPVADAPLRLRGRSGLAGLQAEGGQICPSRMAYATAWDRLRS